MNFIPCKRLRTCVLAMPGGITITIMMMTVMMVMMMTMTILLSGCDFAPLYHAPDMALPAQYSGVSPFIRAMPDAPALTDHWWMLYQDDTLSSLEQHLNEANPDLAAAIDIYAQARAVTGEARAALLPQIGLNAGVSENKESAHTLFHTDTSPDQQQWTTMGAAISWLPDFWGSARNRLRMAQHNAQASAADLAAARLSLETELASDYMAMRGLDAEHAAYQRAIALYRNALNITQMRLADKIAAGIDVARAQNQLASAQAADTEVLAQRAVLEHAVAVLAGINPIGFHLHSESDMHIAVPAMPLAMPSVLLQRRPDIAAAERRMAAANANIGIARAAFFPSINLGASGGLADTGWQLASLPNALWVVGASVMQPVFEGGLRRARLKASWAQFAQTRDQYRSVVLRAFREVEDNISLSDRLAQETAEQTTALHAAQRVQGMALTLYTGGIDNYLNVTVAQIAALEAEIASVKLQTRRLQTSIALIAALGGGWDASSINDTTRDTIRPTGQRIPESR
jgi:NodT family efflux transporter outer membrane factor (OMF) lipoprotein